MTKKHLYYFSLIFSFICLLLFQQTLVADDGIAKQAELNPAELNVGIFPRRNPPTTVKIFTPLIEYLEKQLQIPVKLKTAKNFKVFLKRLKNGDYDLVHFNQYHYINAHQQLDYQAIVQNEEFGEKMIKGAIYVHQDSNISKISQLKNKKIIFGGDKSAMMSYIVPTYLLRQGGLHAGDYQPIHAINPPNAVLATYLKQADAGGAGEIVRKLPLVTKKIDVSKLRLIAVSEPLPHLPWAVKADLPAEFVEKLRLILLNLKQSDEGKKVLKKAKLTGFNAVSDKDYDAHRIIFQAIQ